MIQFNIATGVNMHGFFDLLADYNDLYRLCRNGPLAPLGCYEVKRHEIYVTHSLIAGLREAP